MELRIIFTGLCLYGRDERKECLEVLMPDTTCCKPHHALMYTAKWHLDPSEPSNDIQAVPIGGEHLQLAESVGGSGIPGIPEEVFDASTSLSAAVIRANMNNSSHTHARITVRGGRFVDAAPGGWWCVKDRECTQQEEEQMTNRVIWEMAGLPDAPVKFTRSTVEGEALPDLTLHPKSGVIELHVYHGVPDHNPTQGDEPVAPPVGTSAKHFEAFYTLLDAPSKPLPKFKRPRVKREKAAGLIDVEPKSDLYTCMSAQAPVRP